MAAGDGGAGRLLALALAALTGRLGRADTSPFSWDTVQDMSYSFCYNASGPYNPDALAALAKTKLFIHGMNEMQTTEPAFLRSEEKIVAAANQMRAANPEQLQFYTVQVLRAQTRRNPPNAASRHVLSVLAHKRSWVCRTTSPGRSTTAARGSTLTRSACSGTQTTSWSTTRRPGRRSRSAQPGRTRRPATSTAFRRSAAAMLGSSSSWTRSKGARWTASSST